jgi:hypothetical protein
LTYFSGSVPHGHGRLGLLDRFEVIKHPKTWAKTDARDLSVKGRLPTLVKEGQDTAVSLLRVSYKCLTTHQTFIMVGRVYRSYLETNTLSTIKQWSLQVTKPVADASYDAGHDGLLAKLND